jgi:hypothetical protein
MSAPAFGPGAGRGMPESAAALPAVIFVFAVAFVVVIALLGACTSGPTRIEEPRAPARSGSAAAPRPAPDPVAVLARGANAQRTIRPRDVHRYRVELARTVRSDPYA